MIRLKLISLYAWSNNRREFAMDRLCHIKNVMSLKLHPHPTGYCNGCGKPLYHKGQETCSKECAEEVEFNMAGYE